MTRRPVVDVLRGLSVALALAILVAGCRPAGPRAAPGLDLPSSEPVVRVGIAVDTARVTVSSDAELELVSSDGSVRSARAGAAVAFRAGEGRIEVEADGRSLGEFDRPITVRTRSGAPVRIGETAYRGGVVIRPSEAGRLTAINTVELEQYLLGVVPHEIGHRPEAEIEAVKAQAIAARTYAISHLGNRSRLGFDYYATVSDQVYGGTANEGDVASRAVRETRGEIVTHRGQPILAFYHSTCGGRTAAVDQVWQRSPLPYLKSESDMIPGGDRAYCEMSNRYRWTESWRSDELARILSAGLAAHHREPARDIARIEEIVVTERTPSGRVGTLRITADGRSHDIPGDSVRWVLRPEPGRLLNSSLFELEVDRQQGAVQAVSVRGGGWGHGIGMCQMGAIGRAAAGQDYRRILAAYYRGTDVVRLY